MLVSELRKALSEMPGEMNVYLVNGNGVASARHLVKLDLVGMDQCCELRTYFEDHTPQLQDTLIERETGFADRRELIDAYKAVLASVIETQSATTAGRGPEDESAASVAGDAQPISPNITREKDHA